MYLAHLAKGLSSKTATPHRGILTGGRLRARASRNQNIASLPRARPFPNNQLRQLVRSFSLRDESTLFVVIDCIFLVRIKSEGGRAGGEMD